MMLTDYESYYIEKNACSLSEVVYARKLYLVNYNDGIYALAHLNLSTARFKCIS